ncbi:12-oxophytodienoate reductase [Arthrobacter sp. B0490]|uniref:oxidoreductase n=1 Tax=Arthrobacter sp. B0490 TaxID=2058891 RepID=UPI000CE4936F|nr:12-oxophytodienoate reductase [Arthrobacter sp. B0490]
MTDSLTPLFSPFNLKSLSLRNRFAMAPMTREMSPGGIPTSENAEHYRMRVEGGAALIITEGAYIDDEAASGPRADVPRLTEHAADGWRGVVNAVHDAGGSIVPQLWHVGALRGASPPLNPGVPALSPSGLDLDAGPLGEPMTTQQIDQVITSFADAAALAQRIGFDGVELHGAHGYLLDEFLWKRTNTRDGRYGTRVQMPLEVVQAVRSAVGENFAVIFRFSQWKASRYTERIATTPTELEKLLVPLGDAGVDAFHASTRRHWHPEFPDDDAVLSLAGWTKRLTGRSVITVGSVGVQTEFRGAGAAAPKNPLVIRESVEDRLDYLAEQFRAGEFDVVAVGRALVADPAWVAKVRAGHLDQVVPFDRTQHSLSGA